MQDDKRLRQELVEGGRVLEKPAGADEELWHVARRCMVQVVVWWWYEQQY